MFDLEKAIGEWRQEMHRAGIRNPEVVTELEAHLRENFERLKPERRDQSAFHVAIMQLGDYKKLKEEFAKVHRFRFWMPKDNPRELNVLAVCFMCIGLNSLACMMRLMSADWVFGPNDHTVFIVTISSWGSLAFQLFVGLGLIYRSGFLRWCVYPLGAVQAVLSLLTLGIRSFGPESNFVEGTYYPCMGFMIPMRFYWIPEVFALATVIWGYMYLSSPAIRTLFRNKMEQASS